MRGKQKWMWPRVQLDVWGNLKCVCSRHAWPDATQISNPIKVQIGPLGRASAGSHQRWAIAKGTEGPARGRGLATNSWVMMMHKGEANSDGSANMKNALQMILWN